MSMLPKRPRTESAVFESRRESSFSSSGGEHLCEFLLALFAQPLRLVAAADPNKVATAGARGVNELLIFLHDPAHVALLLGGQKAEFALFAQPVKVHVGPLRVRVLVDAEQLAQQGLAFI